MLCCKVAGAAFSGKSSSAASGAASRLGPVATLHMEVSLNSVSYSGILKIIHESVGVTGYISEFPVLGTPT